MTTRIKQEITYQRAMELFDHYGYPTKVIEKGIEKTNIVAAKASWLVSSKHQVENTITVTQFAAAWDDAIKAIHG